MRQVLRFEGLDGRGPACGGHRTPIGGNSSLAEEDGLLLCIYTVTEYLIDPDEGQALFAKYNVIAVEKIPPASFCPEVHLKN